MKHRMIGMLASGLTTLGMYGCSSAEHEDPTASAPGKPGEVAPLPEVRTSPTAGATVAAPATTTGAQRGNVAIPGALRAAHEAYLNGDFVALGERLREVLLDPGAGQLVRDNALALLDKAYEVRKGALPSAFVVPPTISKLQYACRHFVTPHGASYQIRFAGSAVDASRLVGVTVRLLPGGLVMDKVSGQGSFSVRHDAWAKAHGVEEFVLDSPMLEQPPPDGVVSLRLELDDGTVSEGFLLTHALRPSSDPEILSPAAMSSLAGPNPLVRWTTPRLTGATGERVRSGLAVSHEGESSSLWEFSDATDREAHEVSLGSAAGSSSLALSPGDYRLSVSAVGARFFGPVEVLRSSRVSRPFHLTE